MRMELQLNPILIKELRSRLRGGRVYLILSGSLLGLGIICYGVLRIAQAQADSGMQILSAHVGQSLFAVLALAVTLLVTFLSPALTAGAISSEREQLTYDMLVATPLRPERILTGKLFAALSYVLLLIFTTVPLGSLVLIFGGVAPNDLLKALLLLLLTALATGILGLLCSAMARRTLRATIMAYLLILIVVFGSYFFVAIRNATPLAGPGPRASTILTANPFSAMASLMIGSSQPGIFVDGGFGIPAPAVVMEGGGRPVAMPPHFFDTTNILLNMPPFNMLSFGLIDYNNPNGPQVLPLYQYAYLGYLLFSIACYWLASHFVRPRRRWQIGPRDFVMLALLLVVMGTGTYLLDVWPWS
jgi:ABC-2 type transport system permease protein